MKKGGASETATKKGENAMKEIQAPIINIPVHRNNFSNLTPYYLNSYLLYLPHLLSVSSPNSLSLSLTLTSRLTH